MKRSHLKKGDVLLSIVGTIGKLGLVTTDDKATCSCKLAILRPSKVIAEFLSVFLASKYGQNQIQKFKRGAVQMGLILEDFDQLLIPYFDDILQLQIKALVKNAHSKLEESKSTYFQAENLLLGTLGLADFSPSTEKVNIKSFKDSFAASGRLDAEYYQPKYEGIEKACFEKAVYIKRIKDFRLVNSRGLQPEYVENGKLNVINSRHILERELDYKNFEKTNLENWDNQAKARVFRDDILIYTTGANIGRTQVYLSDEKALASNHVNILRIENENAVYVAFVLNSIIGRMQTEQLSAGSAQQELYPKDIDNFYVPFNAPEIQTNITELIQRSLTLKNESERLLDTAKRAVEIAIEQDETAGMAYIQENT